MHRPILWKIVDIIKESTPKLSEPTLNRVQESVKGVMRPWDLPSNMSLVLDNFVFQIPKVIRCDIISCRAITNSDCYT